MSQRKYNWNWINHICHLSQKNKKSRLVCSFSRQWFSSVELDLRRFYPLMKWVFASHQKPLGLGLGCQTHVSNVLRGDSPLTTSARSRLSRPRGLFSPASNLSNESPSRGLNTASAWFKGDSLLCSGCEKSENKEKREIWTLEMTQSWIQASHFRSKRLHVSPVKHLLALNVKACGGRPQDRCVNKTQRANDIRAIISRACQHYTNQCLTVSNRRKHAGIVLAQFPAYK